MICSRVVGRGESANAGGMREFKTVEGLVVVTNDAKMSGGAEKIDDGRHGNSLGDRDEARVEARGTAFPLPRFPPLHGSRSGSPISAPVDQISETVPYGRCYQ